MKALRGMDPSQTHAFIHIFNRYFQCLCSTLGVCPTKHLSCSFMGLGQCPFAGKHVTGRASGKSGLPMIHLLHHLHDDFRFRLAEVCFLIQVDGDVAQFCVGGIAIGE